MKDDVLPNPQPQDNISTSDTPIQSDALSTAESQIYTSAGSSDSGDLSQPCPQSNNNEDTSLNSGPLPHVIEDGAEESDQSPQPGSRANSRSCDRNSTASSGSSDIWDDLCTPETATHSPCPGIPPILILNTKALAR